MVSRGAQGSGSRPGGIEAWRPRISRACLAGTLLAATASPARGQESALDSLLRANAHILHIEQGEITGAGADLLLSAAERSRFVALGEEHNTRAIPAFTTALFRLLHRGLGFDHLALEEGPALGRMLSHAARVGGRDSVVRLGLRYPNAFHMYTEDELGMIGDIGWLSTARSDPVWGLNQEVGAAHVFQRLGELAPDATARAAARAWLDQALVFEAERFQKNVHYVGAIPRPDDFARLRAEFRPAPGSEADGLIEQLALSNRIYAPYFAEPAASPAAFLESGRARETNMKRLFTLRYREAVAAGGQRPRVLVKSGHLHLYRGLSPRTELYTLGNYLSEVAILDGGEALHVYAIVDRPYVRGGWLAPFAAAALPAAATVFDLRPLYPWARRQADLAPDLRRLILGYDVLVFLRDGEAGSLERLRTPNFRWYPEGR